MGVYSWFFNRTYHWEGKIDFMDKMVLYVQSLSNNLLFIARTCRDYIFQLIEDTHKKLPLGQNPIILVNLFQSRKEIKRLELVNLFKDVSN